MLAVLSPLLLLAIWVLVAEQGWVSSTLLASPWQVLKATFNLFTNGY